MNIHVMTHDELKCVRKRIKKLKNKTKKDIVSLYEVEREIILKIRSLYKNKNCTES